jgi:helix-turn-helix protein
MFDCTLLWRTAMEIETIKVRQYPDGRLDTWNAALYLGLKTKTLAMMRTAGEGPKFVKRGRIFYYKEDLDEWLRAGRVHSTAQARVTGVLLGGSGKRTRATGEG